MAYSSIRRNLKPASPLERFWQDYGLPRRGEFGGPCNNAACQNAGADWLNRASGQFYCDDCARRLNENCLNLGIRKLCELHAEHH
jgi:hypothetical protein